MSYVIKEFFLPIFPQAPRGRFFFAILIIITSLYVGLLQLFPSMPDPDGFYHAILATLTWQQGFVTQFPYLPETIIATYWTDQHFLYHALVAPLTHFINPLWAVKIFSVILGIIYIALFYKILTFLLQNPRLAFWWSIVLLTAGPFIQRIVLVKAQPFALILLLLGLYLYSKKRYDILFVIQFVYVLAHGSFLVLPILIGWLFIYEYFFDKYNFSFKKSVKVFIALLLGLLFGLMVQPTFPQNIYFYWFQTIQVGLTGVPALTLTGTEWESITFIGFLRGLGILSIISILTFVILIKDRLKVHSKIIYWAWILIPLFILTLLSVRNFEFFIPFLVITLALLWQQINKRIYIRTLINQYAKRAFAVSFFSGLIITSLLLYLISPLVSIYAWQKNAVPFTFLKEDGEFIETLNHSNSIVLNTRWDIFPSLLYHSKGARFLTGMDPAFYYFGNPEGYAALVEGRETGDVDPLFLSLKNEYDNIYLAMHSSDKDNKTIPYSNKFILTLLKEGRLISIYKVEPK